MATDLSGWKGVERPGDGPFEGRFARLERLSAARHGADLWAAVGGHDDLWTYMGYGPWRGEAAFLSWLVTREALADPYAYAVIETRTGKARGVITLMEIRPDQGVIEVGHIFFGPAIQRSPAASEAIYLAARHVFDDRGYRRFEWKCHNGNERSKRAALRFGFVAEGLFRQHMVVKGANRDTAWFSIVDGEWPIVRQAFERWLAPANFDSHGAQRLSLAAMNAREVDVGVTVLTRASSLQRAEIEAFQEAAYARNRAILGAEPLPLKWDYATIFSETEVWQARQKDRLVGVLILRPGDDGLMLESVATLPDVQGGGYGNALLNATEFRARDWGLKSIRLITGERLTQNVEWYQRKGFHVETVETLKDRNIVHMVRRLV